MKFLFKVLQDRSADLGGTYAVILLGTILAHAPGRVDGLVQEMVPVVVDALMNTKMERLKMLCFDTVGSPSATPAFLVCALLVVFFVILSFSLHYIFVPTFSFSLLCFAAAVLFRAILA